MKTIKLIVRLFCLLLIVNMSAHAQILLKSPDEKLAFELAVTERDEAGEPYNFEIKGKDTNYIKEISAFGGLISVVKSK